MIRILLNKQKEN